MAEAIILSPIANVVMEMLGSAIVEELGSLWGVKNDLEDIKESLSSIQAVLLDAEEKQSHNNRVRLWLQRLEDVVNDADDLFDEVATEGLRRQLMPARMKKVRIFFSSSNQISFRYKMAKEIRIVKKKLAKIAADRKDFNLSEYPGNEMARPIRRERETRSFVVEENVVGRVGDKREVLELMLSSEKVSVIPIVGMGGLGKTTLAQFIFNDGKVKQLFEPRIWVCVSEDFDERTIVGKIVESITKTCTKDDTLEKLQQMLRERTDGKRYFLVLDDVWSEERHKWQNVKDLLLNCGESGSTIVVTTRSERVARLSSKMQPYKLGILGEDDSWSLFKKMAFEQGGEPADKSIEDIGKQIVKKCGGIPLAIRLIAGMVSELDPKKEWSTFLNKELSIISQKEDDILRTLRLSYNCLPSQLKHCFAYCSLFPKDYEIDVGTLVTLWIAQGFIGEPSNGSQSLEDAGYDDFLELVWRSFFQEVEMDKFGDKVVRCKMHDLVHDLAIQVGGEKYASLDHDSTPNALGKARHVSLGQRESIPSSLLQAKKLRSFISPNTYSIESEVCDEVASNFRLLRMLDLSRSQMNEVPISIGKLKHLRYLDLSWNSSITTVPTSITKLVNLQTLKLLGCHELCELPAGIDKLVNLQTLELERCDSLHELPIGIVKLVNLTHLTWSIDELILPRGVSQLTNLRTLSYFTLSNDPTRSMLDELLGLNNLRGFLYIKEIRSGIEVNGTILKEKEHLQSIQLCWSKSNPSIHGASMSADEAAEKTLEGLQPNQNLRALTVEWYDGILFSNWLSSLTNLVELRLIGCFKLKQLSSLESLCSLRKMYVDSCNEMEYIVMDVNGDGYSPIPVFPTLQYMDLTYLPSFKGWKCSNIIDNEDEGVQLMSYFPRLTSLYVYDCPMLTSMPMFPDVKKLGLRNTNPKPFEQTVSASIARPQSSLSPTATDSSSPSPSSTSSFYPLFKLTELSLYCPNKTVVQYLPDWMQGFSCLDTLKITGYEYERFSVGHGRVIWEIEEGDERQMPIGGNRTTWEIFSGVRNLMLDGVEVLKPLSLASQYLTSLETLEIRGKEELDLSSDDIDTIKWESLPIHVSFRDLPNLVALPEWLQHITGLQHLEILHCKNLKTMPASLSSLTSLHICDCPILTFDHQIKWEALTSLHTLTFDDLPQLVTLPEGLQHATTLQTLTLVMCRNLSAIPDWICNMSSLRELYITWCLKIESLPGSIKSLTSLQTLKISDCPILSDRCVRHVGEYWPNICHIPNIDITEFGVNSFLV